MISPSTQQCTVDRKMTPHSTLLSGRVIIFLSTVRC
jgi:hypothetical protein